MIKSFFLIFFPIFYTISIIFYNFFIFSLENTNIIKNSFLNYRLTSINGKSLLQSTFLLFLKLNLFFISIFIIFFFYILKLYSFESKFFYLNNFIIYQLFIISIIFIIILTIFLYNKKYWQNFSIDVLAILIALYFTGVNTLCSNNILNIFVNLELINILIFYSFLTTLDLNFLYRQQIVYKRLWLLTTLTYQFILNFFSSILFFFTFNILLTKIYSSNFIFLNFFIYDNLSPIYLYMSLLFISIFIKFGIGPWIFFKLEIYQGFNLFLLIIYTTIYFLIILIFFINLFIIYEIQLNFITIVLSLNLLILVSLFFLNFIFFYFNIFMFFSFSSLLNLFLILIELNITLLYNSIY